ncbi:MAG: zinc finger Ran-binding domain-containing protein [Gemmatimonadaceae bacterium]
MMDATQMDALSALLDEKRRYEGWLSQLESRRDAAPSHVVDRVRADYAERLRGVIDQLRGRAAEVEGSATDLAGRIATLVAEETARRDARAETELRAAVGELAQDAATHSLAECDEEIARLSAERSSLGSELARVQDILVQVQPPAPPPQPQPDMAPAPVAPGAPLAPPAQTPARGTSSFDELAFLQSVVKSKDGPVAPPSSAASPAPIEDPLRTSSPDYLPPPSLNTPRRPTTEETAAVRVPSMTPDDMASFFKDAPTEQVKTLKCQECGTLNYPTEWYCERCGGELATM